MNKRIPYLDELRNDLLVHAPAHTNPERRQSITRRRVGRLTAAASAFVVILLAGLGTLLLVSNDDSGIQASSSARGSTLRVSMNGALVVIRDGEAVACRRGDEDGVVLLVERVGPPNCSWEIELLNLNPATLPESQSADGVTWTERRVVLVGDFNVEKRTLILTKPPGPLPSVPALRTDLRRNPPCDPPLGGYIEQWGPNYLITESVLRVAREYAKTESDTFAGSWADRNFRVYTMAFTSDLTRHKENLAELYEGPLCVWQHEATREELGEILAEVEALDVPAGDLGPTILRAQIDDIDNRVDVLLWLADNVALESFEEYDENTVNVSGWIEVID